LQAITNAHNAENANVPEPGTLMISGTVICGCLAMRRRRASA